MARTTFAAELELRRIHETALRTKIAQRLSAVAAELGGLGIFGIAARAAHFAPTQPTLITLLSRQGTKAKTAAVEDFASPAAVRSYKVSW